MRISEPQRRRLLALWKSSDISEEELRTYLKNLHGFESTKDITLDRYGAICAWVTEKE